MWIPYVCLVRFEMSRITIKFHFSYQFGPSSLVRNRNKDDNSEASSSIRSSLSALNLSDVGLDNAGPDK